MKSALSSLVSAKNPTHSAISRCLLQHSSKPISQTTFLTPTIPRNSKSLYYQRYQNLQIRPFSTSIMASSFKPEQARAPPAISLPTLPVTKAISFFVIIIQYFFILVLIVCLLKLSVLGCCCCSSRLGFVSCR